MTATPVLLTGVGPTPFSWGIISGAGAIVASTGDFTLAHTATGEYTLTWLTEKAAANYAAVANCGGTVEFATTAVAKATVLFQTFNKEGTKVDTAFSFIVVGP